MGQDMIYLVAFTGLRRNELLALEYRDVDWRNREIKVTKSISKTKASDGVHKWEWRIGPAKSRKSHRRIAAPDAVLDRLRRLRSAAKDPAGLIFRGADGRRMDPDYFDASVFAPIAQHAQLGELRFHDLRHFFASMLIAQGESAKYVSDQMGHSSIQVTFDTYGHLFPNSREAAATKLEQAMYEGRKKAFGRDLVEKPVKTASEQRAHKRRG